MAEVILNCLLVGACYYEKLMVSFLVQQFFLQKAKKSLFLYTKQKDFKCFLSNLMRIVILHFVRVRCVIRGISLATI